MFAEALIRSHDPKRIYLFILIWTQPESQRPWALPKKQNNTTRKEPANILKAYYCRSELK